MLRSIARGISLEHWDYMTVGMILDYIISFDNEYLKEEKNNNETEDGIRTATQADFDTF